MKKVLWILSSMNVGGAETFIMKMYRHIDRTKYQFDFCINEPDKCYYENEIISFGGNIFRIPSKSNNSKEFRKQLLQLLIEEQYERVVRVTSNGMGFWDLKIAKKAGVKLCCARSSNSSDGAGLKQWFAHRIGRMFFSKYIDVAIAPSDLAAIYTFGEKAYRKNKVKILKNAIDLDVFLYSEAGRKLIREEFEINENTLLVGHIGRFMEQKNHVFLIEIFNDIIKLNQNVKLMLVGKGPLEEEIKKIVEKYGLENNVIFTGLRADIPNLLSAMDVLVFPSIYEGMPNTIIEAQATGLPSVISSTITKQADITGLVNYMDLSKSSKEWANSVISVGKKSRENTSKYFKLYGYDIQSVTREFIHLLELE